MSRGCHAWKMERELVVLRLFGMWVVVVVVAGGMVLGKVGQDPW